MGPIVPGRLSHLAIDAARAAGLPIVLAGKCSEPLEKAYFEQEIKPRLGSDTEIFGVADAAAKRDLLSRACVLLFPICWEEPFGLVMIEAMACGTPVIAYNRGSVPEIIEDGLTGFIVEDETSAVGCVARLGQLSRPAIRKRFEMRFTARRMALDYLAAYRGLMETTEPRIKLVSSAE